MASTNRFKSLCVFCGSSSGISPVYRECAEKLGKTLAGQGIGLVYGGAHLGLMGAVADAALSAGGTVVGVMPQSLIDREIGHRGLTELHIVNTMHERKALMASLADGFIALPGGHGTLDEFCEILTWAQLGLHSKPCGVLNVNGYYDALLAMFDHAVREGFLRAVHRDMVLVADTAEELLEKMSNSPVVPASKWAKVPELQP